MLMLPMPVKKSTNDDDDNDEDDNEDDIWWAYTEVKWWQFPCKSEHCNNINLLPPIQVS